MSYFVPKTADDLKAMRQARESENAHLEFKSSRILNKNNAAIFSDLSKEVVAFANAAGGVIIIGAEDDNRCFNEIAPIEDSLKDEEYFENGLLSKINPPAKFSITKIILEAGFVIVIDVPISPSAPHQAFDNKYYARRLYNVDPLLPFEIDDIRRRELGSTRSASLSLTAESGLFYFEISNTGMDNIYDVYTEIEGISNEEIAHSWSPGLERPYTEPFKLIYPGEARRYPATTYEHFKRKLSDEMIIWLRYTDSDGTHQETSKRYYLEDLASNSRQKEPLEDKVEEINKNIERIERTHGRIQQALSDLIERAVHPTGINLSLTTLSYLSGNPSIKWPGPTLGFQALSEILEVDLDLAHKIHRELFAKFHYVGGQNKTLEEIDLSDDVKTKIRQRLTGFDELS